MRYFDMPGISDSVFNAVASYIVARAFRHVQVKSRTQDFMIYELVGLANAEDPELRARRDDRRLRKMTSAASRCFEVGDLACAAVIETSLSSSRMMVSRRRCSRRVGEAARLRPHRR
jgi:hypothetical protein